MSKKSPNVVFKSRYSLALTCRDNKNKSLNYKEERLKDVDDMIDYYSDEKKKTVLECLNIIWGIQETKNIIL